MKLMKRLLLLLISVFALVSASWADQITREQALAKAQQFLSQKGLSRSLKVAETQMSRARARGKSTPDYYYVFNAGQNQGFVIISGDNATEEVLGYSTSGAFDLNNIPPAMEALLNYYSEQISMIQQGKAQAAPKRATHSAVSPFMTVKWNQSEPYNGKTPLGYYTNRTEGYNCVTGCVATAMAQVLYYQRFVNSTQAEITGYKNQTSFTSPSGVKEANVPTIPQGSALDWTNMVDSYNGSESQNQKDAVANLMLYCGAAVQMNYGLNSSSASNSKIPDALKKYFGYSRGTRHINRSNYSDDDWDNLIYNEIALGRPVIYGGQTKSNSGHSFIVHGYDGAGKYAINWGWGGYQDNYFTLDNLTPSEQGTGGGKIGEGYNFEQEAVINLAKEDGTFSEQVRFTTESLALSSKSVFNKEGSQFHISFKAKFVSRLANTYDISYNFAIYKDGTFLEYLNPNGPYQTFSSFSNSNFFPSDGEMSMYLPYWDGTKLYNAFSTPGTYKIVPVSREASSSEWLENEGSDKYYLTAVCTNTQLTLYVGEPASNPDPEVSDSQRDDLKKKFESLKDKITGKQDKVSANAAETASLQSASASASEAVSGVDDKITALKILIDEAKLLSDALKADFTNTLADLKTRNNQLKARLDKIIAKLETIKAANDNLKQQLADALKIVNEQIAGVSNITTTKALDEANAKVTELSGQIDGLDVDKVKAELADTKAEISSVNSDTLSELVISLNSDIVKAIADAKAAAEEAEKAAKELAEAKEKCNKAIEDLTKVIDDQTKKYNAIVTSLEELNKKLNEIDNYIKDLQTKAKAISDMIAEMKSPSADRTRATADEIKKYEDALANLTVQIEKLSEAKAKVEQEIKNIEGLKEKTEKIIDDATKLRDQVKNGYADATSTEAVEALITQVTTETTVLNDDGAESINTIIAAINTQIAAIETEITAINTDVAELNKQTEDLNKEVTAGIGNISIDENDIQGRYDLNGRSVDANYKGAMIIRMTNGKTITIFKR